MNKVVNLDDRRKVQKTRDDAFSELMDRRYEQHAIVTKAVGTLQKRGHDSSGIAGQH